MKIISINSEHTLHPQQIAFNLDEPWTEEYKNRMNHESLSFKGEGSVLVVTIQYLGETPPSEKLVTELNSKLSTIAKSIEEKAKNRQEMLNKLAQQTNLPLN